MVKIVSQCSRKINYLYLCLLIGDYIIDISWHIGLIVMGVLIVGIKISHILYIPERQLLLVMSKLKHQNIYFGILYTSFYLFKVSN